MQEVHDCELPKQEKHGAMQLVQRELVKLRKVELGHELMQVKVEVTDMR